MLENRRGDGRGAMLLCTAVAVMATAVAGCSRGGPPTDRAAADCSSRFSDTNELHGTLTTAAARAYSGTRAIKATYDGSTVNGYARGVWHVDWRPGDDVRWGTAVYLPRGTVADIVDYFALMRWDNFGAYRHGDDKGGIVFQRGRGWELTGGPMRLRIPELPEGRWFTIEVHEILAQDDSGRTEVYVNGRQVASATGPNMARSPIDRLRVGIVGITARLQNDRLTAYFDRAGCELSPP